MFFRMLLVMIVGVMVGFIAARSVRVPPAPAIVQADVDLTIPSDGPDGSRVLRIYDIQDIVDAALADEKRLRAIEPPQLWLANTMCFNFSPSGHSAFEHIEDFISIVLDAVDPESWVMNGGNGGTIRYFDGRLIVTQTPKTHTKLALLLDQMRQTHPPRRVLSVTTPQECK